MKTTTEINCWLCMADEIVIEKGVPRTEPWLVDDRMVPGLETCASAFNEKRDPCQIKTV